MIRQLWTVSVHTRAFLRRYMPTNILLDAIRTQRGLRWGVPAMVLAIPYLYAASICAQLAENDINAALVNDTHTLGRKAQTHKTVLGLNPETVMLQIRQEATTGFVVCMGNVIPGNRTWLIGGSKVALWDGWM